MSGWRKRTIMEMAQEAYASKQDWWKSDDALEAFAKLVREDERDRILDMCQNGLWDGEGIRLHLNKQENT